MRQLLYNRGFESSESAAAFINGTVDFPTDPFLIKDMDAAVERLHKAVTEGEKIAIYGDYDADGVTSTSLLWNFWPRWAWKPDPISPTGTMRDMD